jgi:hypothetical protein
VPFLVPRLSDSCGGVEPFRIRTQTSLHIARMQSCQTSPPHRYMWPLGLRAKRGRGRSPGPISAPNGCSFVARGSCLPVTTRVTAVTSLCQEIEERGLKLRQQRPQAVLERWCCRTGLNCRPLPYQGSALPLSYGSICPDSNRIGRLRPPSGGRFLPQGPPMRKHGGPTKMHQSRLFWPESRRCLPGAGRPGSPFKSHDCLEGQAVILAGDTIGYATGNLWRRTRKKAPGRTG